MTEPGSKPQVLLVTRNLPPLIGGMERLMHNLVSGLLAYSEVTVIGPRGCSSYLPQQTTVVEVSEKLAPFLLQSTWHAIKACRQTAYDLVIGGSGLTGPTLRLLQLLCGRKTMVFLHGLDLVVNNAVYQAVFTPCIRRADRLIANSHNTKNLAIAKGVSQQRIAIINPGTDLPERRTLVDAGALCKSQGISFEKIIIFVGRITRRKGLSRFIQHSLGQILAAQPEAGLVVVGDNPQDSLNKLGEQNDVLALLDALEYRDRVKFLGQVSDAELTACYAAADVQVFPLVDIPGDVEGFGMIAIEAAACGTPTVAFDLGGVADAVSSDNGCLVSPGDYQAFSAAVTSILESNTPGQEACIQHAGNYSWPIFHSKVKTQVEALVRAS